tara:strand:+ start:2910 stop:3419 length:510 start_codon:yes stop_codon:yes gene_type:complete
MPNSKGGRGYKKGGKKNKIEKNFVKKDDKEPEEYAYIGGILGNGRFKVNCMDGIERLGIISGKLRKRTWINNNDLVLICKWEFQDGKCNIIHKYDQSDEKKLLIQGEISSDFISQNRNTYGNNLDDSDSDFDFDVDSDTDIEENTNDKNKNENIPDEWIKTDDIDIEDI